jgi:hypothetical protein
MMTVCWNATARATHSGAQRHPASGFAAAGKFNLTNDAQARNAARRN